MDDRNVTVPLDRALADAEVVADRKPDLDSEGS